MAEREIYIFMGPPGSGKGTLAQRCVEELGFKQLSTGVLCREHVALQSELGKQIDFILKSGKLISDDLVIAMVEQWLIQHKQEKSLVLDGFPRTGSQVEALLKILKSIFGSAFRLHVVRLKVDDRVAIERLMARAICSNPACQAVYTLAQGQKIETMVCSLCGSPLVRRSDDTQETIRKRLAVYAEHEKGMLSSLSQLGFVPLDLPAERPMNEVFDCFKHAAGIQI